MANLILEKSQYVQYYTHLIDVFENVDDFVELKWVITGLQCNTFVPGLNETLDHITINGDKLLRLLKKCEFEPQFIWANLSGFDKTYCIDYDVMPYADGNPRYWNGNPEPEMKGCVAEIVCWDSSLTMYLGISDIVSAKLMKLYPDIRPLLNNSADQQ